MKYCYFSLLDPHLLATTSNNLQDFYQYGLNHGLPDFVPSVSDGLGQAARTASNLGDSIGEGISRMKEYSDLHRVTNLPPPQLPSINTGYLSDVVSNISGGEGFPVSNPGYMSQVPSSLSGGVSTSVSPPNSGGIGRGVEAGIIGGSAAAGAASPFALRKYLRGRQQQ